MHSWVQPLQFFQIVNQRTQRQIHHRTRRKGHHEPTRSAFHQTMMNVAVAFVHTVHPRNCQVRRF